MKLIDEYKRDLELAGFRVTQSSFNDKSATWLDIYQKKKHLKKGKSIGSFCFNYTGTKLKDMSFHTNNASGTAFIIYASTPKKRKKAKQ